MNKLDDTLRHSRRSFLKGSGLTLAGFGLGSLLPAPFVRQALADGPLSDKKLLFIFQRGGNDGINTLIPHGDPDYDATLRPTLYISPSDGIDLNGFASFHPALSDLMDVWNDGELAAVHRVGYPEMSRSHFDGQRIIENGDPTRTQFFEGWLYRYVQENAITQGAKIPVITSQTGTPTIIKGDESFVNVSNPDAFDYLHQPPKRTKYESAWSRIYQRLTGLEPYRPLLADTGIKLIDVLDTYRSWEQENWDPKDPDTGFSLFPVSEETNPDDPEGPNGKKFAEDSYEFFRSLKLCALSLLESAQASINGTRVAGTQLGGWDHHDGQGALQGTHPELLSWLAYGMRSLKIALSGAAVDPRAYPSIWDDTVVITLTEFGRTSAENGSLGTDHAEASALLVSGGNVRGGVYNCDASTWPAGVMFGVEGRYLQHETDYRAIGWEVLRDHMGADPATRDTVFPGYGSDGLPAHELGLIRST